MSKNCLQSKGLKDFEKVLTHKVTIKSEMNGQELLPRMIENSNGELSLKEPTYMDH